MSKMSCIKCKTSYEEKEQDAYYCTKCLKEKTAIAKEIDAKFANRPSSKQVPKVDIDSLPKVAGKYISAKALMGW